MRAAMIRRRLRQELFPNPGRQVPIALEDDIDPGLVERDGAQLEEKLGCVLVESARDLEAASPRLLGDDGKGNAQRRLPELVKGVELCALADQEFNDVVQSLIGG